MVRLSARRELGRSSHSELMNCAEFFKIYLPEHNSKALSIPPAFIENFHGDIPKKAFLKNSQEKLWHVELEKIKGKLLFKNGWEDFVNDNYLERGDFLIFRYKDAVFTVKVFGANGCQKGETSLHHSDVKVEERHPECLTAEKGSQAGSDETMRVISKSTKELNNPRFSRVFDSRRPWNLVIPDSIFRECDIIPPQVGIPERILLRSIFGVSKPVEIRKAAKKSRQKTYFRVYLSCGWKGFGLSDRISAGDKGEFEIIPDQGRKIREIILVQISPRRIRTRTSTI